MNFVKLTTHHTGDSVWINMGFIVAITPSKDGGSMLHDGTDETWAVRESPEEILAMVSKPRYIGSPITPSNAVDTRGLELPDIKPGSVRAFEGK